MSLDRPCEANLEETRRRDLRKCLDGIFAGDKKHLLKHHQPGGERLLGEREV
jgi:hypothetical protein